jgi:hypothetical protein
MPRHDPTRQGNLTVFPPHCGPSGARNPPPKGVMNKRSPVPPTGASLLPKFHAALQHSKWRAGTLQITRAELRTATKDFRAAGRTGIGAAL